MLQRFAYTRHLNAIETAFRAYTPPSAEIACMREHALAMVNTFRQLYCLRELVAERISDDELRQLHHLRHAGLILSARETAAPVVAASV